MEALQKICADRGALALQQVAEPEPGPGQVLIEVAYAGICGTDLHIAENEFPANPPVTLGHELSGVVAAIGSGVTRAQVGDRVTSETYFVLCGMCRYCRSGQPNLCPERKSIGSMINGAFARYVVVPERNIHHLPANVDLKLGALTEPLACVVRNVQELTQVHAGDVVVISGPGPIGLLALQVCQASGARTIMLGTDADTRRLAAAQALGATHVINIQQHGLAATRQIIADLTNGWLADVVFECAGAAPSAATALELVRRGGRYGQVGLFSQPISIDMNQICYKEIRLFGSNATVPSAWQRALALMAAGAIRSDAIVSDTLPLAAWEAAFARLRAKDALKIMFTPSVS
jgi:L-iditol 2-dehydrogenase